MADWCSTWQLTLNISKCLYIRYGLANKPSLNYSLTGVILSQVSNVTDLGVIFDSKLDFSTHCHKIAAKSFACVNMILKCFHSKDRVLQCKLYKTFVRPILEYNSPIWSPHFIKDIFVLEKVQKYFTKNLKGLQGKNYKERLSILKLLSLECRRAYNDVVFLYKILNGLCDNNLSSLFSKSTLSTFISLCRHSLQVSLPKPRTDFLKFSFCYRSAKLWNTLPECIIKTTSISKFKQLVSLYLCDLYSK